MGGVFLNQVNIVIILSDSIQLDDIWMIQVAKYLDLLHYQVSHLVSIDICFLNYFHRYLKLVLIYYPFKNLTKFSFAQLFTNLYLIDRNRNFFLLDFLNLPWIIKNF